MTEPTTEAGRALLDRLTYGKLPLLTEVNRRILAIEAEARATADAEILALLDRWEADGQGDLVSATAIRALLADTKAGEQKADVRDVGLWPSEPEAERHG